MSSCSSKSGKNEVWLAGRNSCAVLVDDGSQNRFGIERALRGKVEKEITRNCKFFT